MLRRDKRSPEEIEEIIRWCQQDPFWQANILSTQKLREKFDQLALKMKRVTRDSTLGGRFSSTTARNLMVINEWLKEKQEEK